MEAHSDNLNKKLNNIQSKHKKKNTKTQNNRKGPYFYPRTVNMTNRIHKRRNKPTEPWATTQFRKTYWTNLIMGTKWAIKLLDAKLQDPYRILTAKKIQQISSSSNQNRANQKRQTHIIKGINSKLAAEKAMIVNG